MRVCIRRQIFKVCNNNNKCDRWVVHIQPYSQCDHNIYVII